RGRDDVEIKLVALRQCVQVFRKQLHVVFQTDEFARFNQMFASNAAEFRIVQNQIRKLCSLLHQVDLRQTANLVVEALHADQLGQHHAGIVETQCLVKIAGQ